MEKKFYPLRHGLWSKDITKKVSRRTRKWINAQVSFLLEDIAEPSAREIILAEHTSLMDAVCRVYAMQLMAGEAPGSLNHYLAFEGHLQRNLVALGLPKRKVQKILDLSEYLESKKLPSSESEGGSV